MALLGPKKQQTISPTAQLLKGTLEACPYKGPSALVAASFQLAIVAVWGGMSLEASEAG
jgi:hypothetical protein